MEITIKTECQLKQTHPVATALNSVVIELNSNTLGYDNTPQHSFLKSVEQIVEEKTCSLEFEDSSHKKNETSEKCIITTDVPGLVGTVHIASERHYTLILSVTDFILAVNQGFARHVELNSEKVREYFVTHQGKKELVVSLPKNYYPGSQKDDWAFVFPEFLKGIEENTHADICSAMSDHTSVGTATTRIASQMAGSK